MADRAPGLDWVRLFECVDSIARWSDGEDDDRPAAHFFWSLTGDETPYQDNDFAEINERAERHVTIPFTQPFYIDATRDMKPRAGRVIHVREGEPQPWREISGISVSQSEMIGTNERLIEVMEIFQRGCANTQPFGKPPTDCPECKLGFLEVVRDILFPVNESVEDVKP